MIIIPSSQKEWTQTNESDLMGNLWVTKNCTFDDQGYLRLSYSPRASMDDSIDADFDNPAVMLYNEDYGYFVGTWDSAFEANAEPGILSVRPTQIATSGVPTTDIQTDAVWFGGLMPVSQDTDVDYYDPVANTWTDTNISLSSTSGSQHQEVFFLSLSALAIADVNTVKLYGSPLTATPTLLTTLTINSNFFITGMCYFNQNLYIATQNRFGGHAFMYVWNGLGTAANQVYECDSNTIFCLCAHQNSIICLTGNGSLLRFNGGGFDLLAGFPIYYFDSSLSDHSNIDIYKNCLVSNGNLLYILMTNNTNSQTRLINQPDGIWCYDDRVGLYHRYAVSNSLVQYEAVSTADVNTTTNQITTALNFVTGTEVYYRANGGAVIAPLADDVKYYVIRIDATHIQVATTYANAIAGVPIDLTTTGSDFQTMVFYPNVDFGAFWAERTMALTTIEIPTDERQFGVDLLWGAEVTQRDSTTNDRGTLGTVADHVGSRGYFVTPKVYSSNVTDTQNQVTMKFTKFISELDKVVIKYRNVDDDLDLVGYINISSSTAWMITWTSTTTFTTTDTHWANAVVGNEVEVLASAAGGLLAHITAISVNAGTYTVTIDETYSNYTSGDVSRAIFRNWIKWKTIEYGDSNAGQYFLSDQLGAEGKFIQLKVELRGVRTRIEELLIDNISRLPAGQGK